MSDYPVTRKWADKPVLIVGCEDEVGRTIAKQYGFNKAYVAQDVMRWRRDFFPLSPAVEPLPDGEAVSFASSSVHPSELSSRRKTCQKLNLQPSWCFTTAEIGYAALFDNRLSSHDLLRVVIYN